MDKVELIDRAAVRALAYVSSDWSHGAHPLVVELSDIDDLPNIDAAPVRRGEWKIIYALEVGVEVKYLKCSACGRWSEYKYDFCPNCGADMRGEKE